MINAARSSAYVTRKFTLLTTIGALAGIGLVWAVGPVSNSEWTQYQFCAALRDHDYKAARLALDKGADAKKTFRPGLPPRRIFRLLRLNPTWSTSPVPFFRLVWQNDHYMPPELEREDLTRLVID